MDQAVLGFFGALLAVAVGTVLVWRRERHNWLRDQRLDAFASYLTELGLLVGDYAAIRHVGISQESIDQALAAMTAFRRSEARIQLLADPPLTGSVAFMGNQIRDLSEEAIRNAGTPISNQWKTLVAQVDSANFPGQLMKGEMRKQLDLKADKKLIERLRQQTPNWKYYEELFALVESRVRDQPPARSEGSSSPP